MVVYHMVYTFLYSSFVYSFSPKVAELHILGPYRSEIKYDTIKLTEEIKTFDECIIDCRYFEHQWISSRSAMTAITPMEGAQLWVNRTFYN
jgi:hypothetical protein